MEDWKDGRLGKCETATDRSLHAINDVEALVTTCGAPRVQTVSSENRLGNLVHQVRGWYSGAAAYFGWMREAKRENTRLVFDR
jgi:hypothetical protein